ncbi:MAG: alginate export family protein [Candidatus Hydrogenedentes bacterium]|nr:alginate export family protein [Candidatus Hydrogenedentota bacterium]
MYRKFFVAVMAILLLVAAPAYAELQNTQVGGEIRIRGNWWTSGFSPDSPSSLNPLFQGPWFPSFRGVPGGNPLAGLRWAPQPGRLAVVSPVGWDEKNNGFRFVEQRTKLHVRADFTEMVSAFIQIDSYDIWGETPGLLGAAGFDFRSDYVTGVDRRANTADDVEVYQSYIEANEMFGVPLRLRIGRQELKLGSGWLVGTNEAGSVFRGLSFDGFRGRSRVSVWRCRFRGGQVPKRGADLAVRR